MSNEGISKLFNDSKLIIDRTLNIFLFNLIKDIFLKQKKVRRTINVNKKMKDFINKINNNIIIKKFNNEKIISNEYTEKNLLNIFNFIKFQNRVYASEIIENILIFVFNFSFKTQKDDIFEKYLYNDMEKINGSKIIDIINPNKFKDNIELLIRLDKLEKLLENNISNIDYLKDSFEIENEPILSLIEKKEDAKYKKEIIFEKKLFNYLFFSLEDEDFKLHLDNTLDITNSSISIEDSLDSSLLSNYCFEKDFRLPEPKNLFKFFLISVYIYSQNKFSPLMKYAEESKKFVKIPFSYNLSEAIIEDRFSGTILSPLRIEPRIEEIKLAQNPLNYNGFYELSKVLLFNKNIKKIDLNTTLLKSHHMIFLIFGLKLFKKNNVEELDLSFNFFKEDCSEYLANLLLYLNNLKTINLYSNELKRGISSFLIVLKNLYRQGKTKLENLYLNNCQLDDIAFYELGRLLKCKYCKLKKLFLNQNNIPSNINFLKKIKKNNSLIEIYFNRCNIGNKDIDDIMRIISNTGINCIYLNQNQICNFDGLLNIVFRTKLVKIESEKMNKGKMDLYGEPYLYNMDLGKNCCYNKNKDKIELLEKGLEETTLYCLDFSQILIKKLLII